MNEKEYGKQYYRAGVEKPITNNVSLSEAMKKDSPTRWSSGSSLADIQVTISGNEGHVDAIEKMVDEVGAQIELIASKLFKYGAASGADGSAGENLKACSDSKGFVNDIHSRLGDQNKRLHAIYDRLIEVAKALNTLEEELFG